MHIPARLLLLEKVSIIAMHVCRLSINIMYLEGC